MQKLVRCKVIITTLFFVFFVSSQAWIQKESNISKSNDNIKILVLIIASDDKPVYIELQKIWRSYMHNDPEHVEVYFMKCNPHLSSEYVIDGDIIWCRSPENMIPGLTNKTIISMEAFLPRIKTEFDYVLRPNLSSFYVFPRLLNFLKNCPRTNFYCGSNIGDPTIGSGCGFLLSCDLVEMMVINKNFFLNNMNHFDDVLIGIFLIGRGIRLIPHERIEFYNLNQWHKGKDSIPADAFHFRIKNPEHLRLVDDIYIQTQLLNMFYRSNQREARIISRSKYIK